MSACYTCGNPIRSGVYCSVPCRVEGSLKHSKATINAVRAHWTAGKSAAEIGHEVGLTKNQVIGIAHRNGFPARPSPIKRAPE